MEAKIYIADQRGCIQTEKELIWSTFNCGTFYHPDKKPFGAFHQLNEFNVSNGHQVDLPAEEHTFQILIPLHGGLRIKGEKGEHSVAIGELWCMYTEQACTFTVSTCDHQARQFAFIQIAVKSKNIPGFYSTNFGLPIDKLRECLIPVIQRKDFPFTLYIGAFHKKNAYQLPLKKEQSDVLLYNLEGAIEVEDRLLYGGDALALSGASCLEIECLSGAAILLALEWNE